MIKARELRIFNLLQDQNKNILVVDSIQNGTSNNVQNIFVGYVVKDRSKFPLPDGWKAEPIPLTEEWLIKFGFKVEFYGGQGNIMHYGKLGSIEVDLLTGMYDDGKNAVNKDNPIKYVHQLQNLYFALTNEELTIKTEETKP